MYTFRIFYVSLIFFFSVPILAEKLIFPTGFHKGVGFSAYQNGGHIVGKSNWSIFEESFVYVNAKHFFSSVIYNNERVGNSAEFWHRACDDIALLEELGCNAVRFSVEWADIEPERGMFNEAVLDFYECYIDALNARGISPMITLYHFVHPAWFEELGGFAKEENIELFVCFAQKVFARLGSKVRFWCTINEPTVIAAAGYILGIHAPGKVGDFHTSAHVLLNLLNAHVETYYALKAMLHGIDAQIGIVHQCLTAEAYTQHNSWFDAARYYLGLPLAKFLTKIFAHAIVKEFLKTGTFFYRIPKVITLESYNERALHSYDFIGINYYSKVIVGPGPTCYEHQEMTDMDYPMRPECLYEVIVDMAELGKPLYITENGVADAQDRIRSQFIEEHIKQVYWAVRNGFDVRGYYYWTLMDNFEWNDGYSKKFGLYAVDFENQQRELRSGSLPFKYLF